MSPWTHPGWAERSTAALDEALAAVGRSRTGALEQVKAWGRACIQRAPTATGPVWIKHGYRLPPGEELVLARLAERWPDRVPPVVATWKGAVVMEPLPGEELTEDHPLGDWLAAARCLGEICAGEAEHVDEWLALGLRDRRPAAFREAAEGLLRSSAVQELPDDIYAQFVAMLPELVAGYVDAYDGYVTLVHQDSGCCNIHVTDAGPVIFDWSDVVVGHPTYSCDRLLDQVPAERQAAVIEAFCGPIGISLETFRAYRRSNVFHEVLRYHDELAYLAPEDPVHESLAKAVRAQIRVIIEHAPQG